MPWETPELEGAVLAGGREPGHAGPGLVEMGLSLCSSQDSGGSPLRAQRAQGASLGRSKSS